MSLSHYQPVSSLNILLIFFKQIKYNRLLNLLENLKIISKTQFGYRKKYSSYMANKLRVAMIAKPLKRSFVISVFLDFAKVF